MTLPRKSSRSISVDGVDYRWMVTKREGVLHVTVQHASDGGALLIAYLEPHALFRRDGSSWRYVRQSRRVEPRLVSHLIRHALGNGWRGRLGDNNPFVIAIWEAENLASPRSDESYAQDEVPLRDIAIETVSDLRFDFSLDEVWRRKLFQAPAGARFELPADYPGIPKVARDHGLRFRVFNDGWTDNGMVVFVIESVEFPSLSMCTLNNPNWPPGEPEGQPADP